MGLQTASSTLLRNAFGTPGSSKHNSQDRPHEMNRYIGGHNRTNHPYVSGYWYSIIQLPVFLFQGNSDAGTRWLHSAAESFTPPSRTLTKVDVPGMGGQGSSFIAGQQLTRTFTMAFREYQDTPILNTLNLWTNVFDSHYGITPMNANQYIPSNYKGAAYVFLCKPTVTKETAKTISADDVEQFYFFEGVFPEGAPTDSFNSDINTNDVVQLSVTFSFDGWPYGKEYEEPFKKGITLMNEFTFGQFEESHINANASTFNTPIQKIAYEMGNI